MGEGASNVSQLDHHPKRVEGHIHGLATNLNQVGFSTNINDLAAARQVSMRDIWECLESGSVMPCWLKHEETCIYCKMMCHCAEGTIYLDICISKDFVSLEVLFATIEVT